MTKQRFTRPKTSIVLTHGASATTVTSGAMPFNGLLRQILVTTGAVDSSATLTVSIIDVDTNTVWSKASIAASTVSNTLLTQDLSVPLSGLYTINILFSAAQTTTDRTTVVTLLVDRG